MTKKGNPHLMGCLFCCRLLVAGCGCGLPAFLRACAQWLAGLCPVTCVPVPCDLCPCAGGLCSCALWLTPVSSAWLPAIHRGHSHASEAILCGIVAHGATNLFCRGQQPLSGSTLAGVTAHGEMQELVIFFPTKDFCHYL